MIRRPLTEKEWQSLKKALPAFKWLNEIEYVKENCWHCEHYDGHEGMPGRCELHDCAIPNDERGQEQECFVQRILPF